MGAEASSERRRIFPSVTADLYSGRPPVPDAAPDERVAAGLVALAGRKQGRFQRLVSWRLDALDRLGRLLGLHKAAIEAETAAAWHRADFFWLELRHRLDDLWDKVPLWEEAIAAVARHEGISFEGSAIDLRNRLLDELLLDTHHAFFLGLSQDVEKAGPADRAFVHVDAIEKLLDRSSRPAAEQKAVFGPLFEARIAACREAGRWSQAIACATRLADRFSGDLDFQNLLIVVEHQRTMSALGNGKSESASLTDASALQRGIERQGELLRKYPANPNLFESLAALHHLRAIKLANGNRVSQALLEVEKSLAYQPEEEVVEKSRQQLIEMMQALQSQMRAVEASLASRPNAQLNAEGQRLREEARQGFLPAQVFRDSSDAQQIRQALETAHLRALWLRIGLPVPEEGWDDRALSLMKALNKVFAHPPKRPGKIPAVWRHAIAEDAEVADLDPEAIERFLRHRLFGEEQVASFAEPAPLAVASRERQRGGEPILDWLFSRQNPWIKAQAAAGVVLLLLAGGLTLRDARNRQARDLAWTQLEEGARNLDDLRTIRGAEAFFDTSPLPGGDAARQAQARSLYSEALVRWFLRLPGEPDAQALQHIDRYRSFLASNPEEAQP